MMTKDEMFKRFCDLTDRMKQLMSAKNGDYSKGDDPFKNLRRHGLYGIVVRMDDKIARLDNLSKGDTQPVNVEEKRSDTAMDLAVYALLYILMDEELEPPKGYIKGDPTGRDLYQRCMP